MKVDWKGVFPASATQFREDQSLDLAATAKTLGTLIQAGIHRAEADLILDDRDPFCYGIQRA